MTTTTFPLYEHTVRRKLEDLIARVFSPPFRKIFSPVFDPGAAAAVNQWWLSGSLPAANCVAAYDAKNAASLAASYDNLASAATTYDCTVGSAVDWANGTGWKGNTTGWLNTNVPANLVISMVIRYVSANDGLIFSGGRTVAGGGVNGIYLGYVRSTDLIFLRGAASVIAPTISSGVIAISDKTCYKGSTSIGTLGAGAVTSTEPVYLMALNNGGAALAPRKAGDSLVAVAMYDIAIDSYMAALNTAIAAL